MLAPPICPTCRAVRGPNARFCYQCGHDYEAFLHGSAPEIEPPRRGRVEVDVSISTAVKVGFGFAVGATLVGLIVTLVSFSLFGAAIGAFTQSLR